METRSIDDIKALMIESKERIIEIHNSITDGVLTDPELAGLNTTSQTAIWRLWAFVVSVSIWVHEKLWGYFKTEIEAIAARSIAGTNRWYSDMCLQFQYGHNLIFLNYTPAYATTDETARIVTQAAVIDGSYGIVIIKVAKGNIGNLQPLSPAELLSFETFINQIKFAGTMTSVISLAADIMTLDIVVHYNAIYNILAVQQNVNQAIKAYLQALPFNGLFYTNALIDAIQAVAGVVDVAVNLLKAQQGTGVVTTIERKYQSVAGYIGLDETNSIITYSPLP